MGAMAAVRLRARRALWIALGANAGLLVVEVVGGFVFSGRQPSLVSRQPIE